MKLNGRKVLSFFVVLQSFVISPSKTDRSGLCTKSSFTRAVGFVLHGFVLGEMKVASLFECTMRCTTGVNCLSLNILTNADGNFACQLNSGLKENAAREQFVPHADGEYIAFTETKPCINNEASCNSGTPWHAFNQSYFKFVAPRLNFDEAMRFCRAEKGDLASTSSEEEQTFLYNTFLKNNPDVETPTWFGLNDKAEEGVRVWTDGSPVTYTAKFADFQPDNHNGKEHCFEIYVNGDLNDEQCSLTRHFICETNYSSLYT